jgi:hypothetical protein
MAVSQVSNTQAAVTVDATMSPLLIAPKTEAPEQKAKSQKRAKKEPSTETVPSETTPAAPKGKKRAASKGPDEAVPGTATVEEAEKVAGETSGTLVVAKAVRTLLKNHTTPIHLGSDALPALNAKVTELIYEAIGRSLANGRKTLKNSDF